MQDRTYGISAVYQREPTLLIMCHFEVFLIIYMSLDTVRDIEIILEMNMSSSLVLEN